MIQTDKIVET